MSTQEISQQIEDAKQCCADIAAQHDSANDQLRTVQKSFAKGKATVEEVTTAQAKSAGIFGALQMLDQELAGLQSEYSIAVHDENRAAQLDELKAKCEAANQSWQAYGKAHADATRAVEIAAKSLLAADTQHRDAVQHVTRFCSGSGCTVSLSDARAAGIDITGATATIPFFAAPPTGIVSDSEDEHYLQHLNELMLFIERCAKSLRPCPPNK